MALVRLIASAWSQGIFCSSRNRITQVYWALILFVSSINDIIEFVYSQLAPFATLIYNMFGFTQGE